MRRLLRDWRGLSEIVGTLMLVLIVVSAATAFSLFVAGYQKQVQQRQAISQQKSLESLTILRVTPTLNVSLARYALLNFTVASLYINPVTVTEVSVDNNPLIQYDAWRLNLSTGTFQWITVGSGGHFTLGPREQVGLLVDLRTRSSFSFYNSSFVLLSTDYIKVELITLYQNDFSRVFIPPTAIGLVTTLETLNGGGGFSPVTVLDGSHSFPPGNATLISWDWSVFPDNTTYSGEEAVVTFNGAFTHHTVTLRVTNSDGLVGIESFVFP